jgi:anti-sigma regulatory factor (Ser/Thr protein kinase)
MPGRTTPTTGISRPRPRQACPSPALPDHAFLDLDAVVTAPGYARAWTSRMLWEWGVAELAETAKAVTSELVSNSVNASVGAVQAGIRLIVTLKRDELAILVRDDNPGVPLAAQPGAEDEGGRGLLIVENLSDRFGWYPLKDGTPGKVVWAVISEFGQAVGKPPGGEVPGGLPDAGLVAPAPRPAPVPPQRHRQVPPSITGMIAPRVIDPGILVGVKTALERF